MDYTPEEGLRRLGLDPDSTPDEINARFRDLARATHPDIADPETGSRDELSELLAARDAALSAHAATTTTDLAVVDVAGAVAIANDLEDIKQQLTRMAVAQPDGKREVDSLRQSVMRSASSYTSRLRDAERRTGVAAISLGVATGTVALAVHNALLSLVGAGFLGLIALFQSIRYGLLRRSVKDIEYAIEDARDALSDSEVVIDVILELVEPIRTTIDFFGLEYLEEHRPEQAKALPPWTRGTIEDLVAAWIDGTRPLTSNTSPFEQRLLSDLAGFRVPNRRRVPLRVFAATIEARDFAKLLIDSGLSLGVLGPVKAPRDPVRRYEPRFDLGV